MGRQIQKLYCFVDETGQDTKGSLFLVCVILKNGQNIQNLREKLEFAEKHSKKDYIKWSKTKFSIKKDYLKALSCIKELKGSIYYSRYTSSKRYQFLISLTIAKALGFNSTSKNYEATIVIDGLNKTETEIIRVELKKLDVRYRKIRGMKDQQEVLLRLADSMAGFLRDYIENEDYSIKYFNTFLRNGFITQI